MITASSAALAAACQYSFRPDVTKPVEAEVTEEQSRGNLVGAFSEAFISGTPAPKLDGCSDVSESAVRMWDHLHEWLRANKRLGWRAEVAFLYDPVSDVAREVPRAKHRDYSMATPAETCAATLDILSVEGDVLVVRDIKTHAPGAPHPSADEQIEWCALFACRAWGFDTARIETLVVTENCLSVEGVRDLDMFDLADIRARIQAIEARVSTSQPEPGDHCRERYCKLLTTCDRAGRGAPAALAQVIPADALTAKRYAFTTQIEGPEHLRWLLDVDGIVEKAYKAVKAAIANYVAASPNGEVICDDGAVIYGATRKMTRQSKKDLDALLARYGVTEEDIASTYHTVREGNGVKVRAAAQAKAKP